MFHNKNLKHPYATLEQFFPILNINLISTRSAFWTLRYITFLGSYMTLFILLWDLFTFSCLELHGWKSYPLSFINISAIGCFYCLLHLLSKTTALNQFFNHFYAIAGIHILLNVPSNHSSIHICTNSWCLSTSGSLVKLSSLHFSCLFFPFHSSLTSSFLDSVSSYIHLFPSFTY